MRMPSLSMADHTVFDSLPGPIRKALQYSFFTGVLGFTSGLRGSGALDPGGAFPGAALLPAPFTGPFPGGPPFTGAFGGGGAGGGLTGVLSTPFPFPLPPEASGLCGPLPIPSPAEFILQIASLTVPAGTPAWPLLESVQEQQTPPQHRWPREADGPRGCASLSLFARRLDVGLVVRPKELARPGLLKLLSNRASACIVAVLAMLMLLSSSSTCMAAAPNPSLLS
mmetsp:Transcript_112855/g.224569  ORF Transcript_112855/g.224569 Transcript_112855/m.224569 type:complete len:225 (+) Transcript_112855:1507-2181(+)